MKDEDREKPLARSPARHFLILSLQKMAPPGPLLLCLAVACLALSGQAADKPASSASDAAAAGAAAALAAEGDAAGTGRLCALAAQYGVQGLEACGGKECDKEVVTLTRPRP